MRNVRYLALGVSLALLSGGLATAQTASRREPGAIERTPTAPRPTSLNDRPAKPMTPEAEAWLAKDVQAGAEWRLASRDADGVVFAKPAGQVRSDGTVPVHLRIEYRQPLDIKRQQVRSVQADVAVDCGSRSMTGDANGFEGQNLTGKKTFLEASDVTISRPTEKPATQNPRAIGLRLVNSELIRAQCAEGHQGLTAKYGPAWRPLLSDEKGVRLVGAGSAPVTLDRKLDLKFRLEAKDAQSAPALKWRSAIANVQVDCVEGGFTADAQLFAGVDETGASAKMDFVGYRTPLGTIATHAPGEAVAPAAPASPPVPQSREQMAAAFRNGGSTDTGPGKTLVDMMGNGGMVLAECDAAKARLASALADPASPLRKQAEAWASQSLNTKGFRLPAYVPEGVMLLSDEVVGGPAGRKAVVRQEFIRPIPASGGKKMASRITVLEVDCAGKKVRGVSESIFARNGAKDLIREASAPQANWNDFDDAPTFDGYYDAICKSQLAAG